MSQCENQEVVSERPGYDRLWLWFGLSRAGWLTVPRVLMHEMPDDWQNKMAELLEQYDDFYTNQPPISAHVSLKEGGKFTCMFKWLHNYRYPAKHKIENMKSL